MFIIFLMSVRSVVMSPLLIFMLVICVISLFFLDNLAEAYWFYWSFQGTRFCFCWSIIIFNVSWLYYVKCLLLDMHKFSHCHHPRNFLKLLYDLRPSKITKFSPTFLKSRYAFQGINLDSLGSFFTSLGCMIWNIPYNVKHFPEVLIDKYLGGKSNLKDISYYLSSY